MFASSLLTLALASVSIAAPTTAAIDSTYKCYSGNGSPSAGWPAESAWASFDALWSANLPELQNSCGYNKWGANNSPTEISDMKTSILSVAKSTGVDSRYILATIMQESEGCVRVPTTSSPGGVRNPGLMQDHDGTGTCAGKTPCPASEIQQMIKDGTAGTSHGPGLQQLLKQAESHDTSKTGAQDVYIAARLYNSGSADYADLNNGLGATGSYVNDIANRLKGWTTAAKTCTPS